MFKAIRIAAIAFIALMSFALIGDRVVWDTQVWECHCSHDECDECGNEEYEWRMYRHEAYDEYLMAFNELFASYETKRARNGAILIRQGSNGSFKFSRKG